WTFIFGGDWRVAAGLAVAFAGTWALTHHGVNAWWLLPLAVALLLVGSVLRQARSDGGGEGHGEEKARHAGAGHPGADRACETAKDERRESHRRPHHRLQRL